MGAQIQAKGELCVVCDRLHKQRQRSRHVPTVARKKSYEQDASLLPRNGSHFSLRTAWVCPERVASGSEGRRRSPAADGPVDASGEEEVSGRTCSSHRSGLPRCVRVPPVPPCSVEGLSCPPHTQCLVSCIPKREIQ